MNNTESIPQDWDDERDVQFFNITASLFSPAFCYGAGVLLASYDPEDSFDVATAPVSTSVTESLIDTTGALR